MVVVVGCASMSVHPRGSADDQRAVNRVARTADRPSAGGEQAADQRDGVVLLGGGDLHLGWRTDGAGGHQGRRAACEGIIGYCSATWTSRSRPPPTTAREGRRDQGRAGSRPEPAASVNGIGDDLRRHMTAASWSARNRRGARADTRPGT